MWDIRKLFLLFITRFILYRYLFLQKPLVFYHNITYKSTRCPKGFKNYLKNMDYLPGFANLPSKTVELNDGKAETVKKKNAKKSGGFQSMNISFNVIKGITKRGYKQPTPIQRKVCT